MYVNVHCLLSLMTNKLLCLNFTYRNESLIVCGDSEVIVFSFFYSMNSVCYKHNCNSSMILGSSIQFLSAMEQFCKVLHPQKLIDNVFPLAYTRLTRNLYVNIFSSEDALQQEMFTWLISFLKLEMDIDLTTCALKCD